MATTKKPSKAAPSEDLTELQSQIEEQGDSIIQMRSDLQAALKGYEDLSARFGKLELASPTQLRRMDITAVRAAKTNDPFVSLEVLEDWGHVGDYLPKGRVIRADHYPKIEDWVRSGLQLGVPADQEKIVAILKKQGAAREQAILNEAKARMAGAQSKADEEIRQIQAAIN